MDLVLQKQIALIAVRREEVAETLVKFAAIRRFKPWFLKIPLKK
jgi:hypothetical protein